MSDSENEIDLCYDDFDVEIQDDSDIIGGKKTKKSKKKNTISSDDEEDDEENENSNENIFEKDPNVLAENMIGADNTIANSQYRGVRDPVKYRGLETAKMKERLVVPAHMRRTSHRLSMAERTNLIGTRATHISMGAQVYVTIGNLTNATDIAIKELKNKMFPFNLERQLNSHEIEYWNPNEMTISWD
jgi:DNA-directed RNA polymerase subunit K/omega